MLNPMLVSSNIKESFVDYIATSFDFADKEYREQFRKALLKDGAVAKGPYLDIGGSYETGKSLTELMAEGTACPLFADLEKAPEAKKELKLIRPLYAHQEAALRKSRAGNNLIVTTGTGSGKTECFLIPLIDRLLQEIESGTITHAVRAIVIYPMNALANDQMKRLRALLKDYPEIRFGLYNGNTEHRHDKGVVAYRQMHGQDPLPNEVVSREDMQQDPPHILVTNYSMLEYLLLRPKDDEVFRNAQLRFVILDEAHIYRGATGIETALLLRRLKARVATYGNPQYILTSATLGSEAENQQILDFGKQLCGVSFKADCIIRSHEKRPDMIDHLDFDAELFSELADETKNISDILLKYQADYAPDGDSGEKLYQLCLRSRLYSAMRSVAVVPMTITDITTKLCDLGISVSKETLTALISVCTKAEHDGTSLIKARYHYFVRALEGAYVTLGTPKKLFLHRIHEDNTNGKHQRVFEASICSHCGRLAITGTIENGKLEQKAASVGDDRSDYFVVKHPDDTEWYNDGDEEDEEALQNDFIVCTICGACASDHGKDGLLPCDHEIESFVRLHMAQRTASGKVSCPACENGTMRRFYLGSEAATAVLATELYEQLPTQEVVQSAIRKPTSTPNIFARRQVSTVAKKDKVRQFLCFSDSRNEAAFFANYMEQSYAEFLRRRGMWHVVQKLREDGQTRITVKDFVQHLTAYFESKRSFVDWDARSDDSAAVSSRENAWVAVLNELFNARRATSLISMGLFSPHYRPNTDVAESFADGYGLTTKEAEALLDLLVMDGVYTGAINAGKSINLREASREYIFYTHVQQKLVKEKLPKSYGSLSGWCGRKRPSGKYYPNARLARITAALNIHEDQANDVLEQYWDGILAPENQDEVILDANDFDLVLDTPFWRCTKCGKATPFNVQNRCASTKCVGHLEAYDALTETKHNHYAKLYSSTQMAPLHMKEHTAQLSKDAQLKYQEAFVKQQLNALSCSTTFEMGVDVGSLETVYLRNVPPNPSNYVQRAGRAGRSRQSAAYVMTYAKLSSHDFTYYAHPESMISGKISAPVFKLENEKIVRRHIYAVALSYFFQLHPEVYDGDNRAVFLLEDGYQLLKDLLSSPPEDLIGILKASIPTELHQRMGLLDNSWVRFFVGEEGVLELAYQSFHSDLSAIQTQVNSAKRKGDLQSAAQAERQLQIYRAGKEDNHGRRSLIDYLVRNNVLPKYGFPVDTVELMTTTTPSNDGKELSLSRDLQMAIAEYAPGAEVVADGHIHTSRYIRKGPMKGNGAWEHGWFSTCRKCGQCNFVRFTLSSDGSTCVSCGERIPRSQWKETLEPRMGFISDGIERDVQMHKPERAYRTEDYYVGDSTRHTINEYEFIINNNLPLKMESTTNDALVVLGRQAYYVCPVCGYADEDEKPIREGHKNARGFKCSGTSGKRYMLSHHFLTDVVKLTFDTSEAKNQDTMFSVMFALLEGLSRKMGIERTDIKGCLHLERSEQHGMVFSIVLYDAVAGGAGHVRRMVDAQGTAFKAVMKEALTLVQTCSCDTSCYRCLRNYYNQKLHDRLSRHAAENFISRCIGEMKKVEDSNSLEDSEVKIHIRNSDFLADYEDWDEVASLLYPDTNMERWQLADIPFRGEVEAQLLLDTVRLDTIVVWQDEKVAVCESIEAELSERFNQAGWKLFSLDADPSDIRTAIQEG